MIFSMFLESTCKLFAAKPMMLMSVAFVYSGVELAFRSAIYPTCVSFTQQLGANTKALLALSVIVQSLGQVCCKLVLPSIKMFDGCPFWTGLSPSRGVSEFRLCFPISTVPIRFPNEHEYSDVLLRFSPFVFM